MDRRLNGRPGTPNGRSTIRLAVAKWHMSRRVRACNYKAVITGEGSDELFGGYPFFKRDWLGREDEDGIFCRRNSGRRRSATSGVARSVWFHAILDSAVDADAGAG